VPRDIATREIFDICVNEGMGVGGENQVYLDLTHKPRVPREEARRHPRDLREVRRRRPPNPHEDLPRVHYSMGGLWTSTPEGDYKPAQPLPPQVRQPRSLDDHRARACTIGAPNNMMTNIKGLYAFGEVNFAYHGANRLGANALLSCIFDGLFCGVSVVNYVREAGLPGVDGLPASIYDAYAQREQAKVDRLVASASASTGDPQKPIPDRQGTGRRDDRGLHRRQDRAEPGKVRSPNSPSS
jgi:succinate dehydrogenase / fumarate reductase flavoprotein subunit